MDGEGERAKGRRGEKESGSDKARSDWETGR